MALSHLVVDGSNIATEGRDLPSLAQLDEAVQAFIAEFGPQIVTVVVDASFPNRIARSERKTYEDAVAAGEIITPPAGAIGRGDAFILQIADRAQATILSNDSFQEFHGQYEWLFDQGRLVGGKPVPHVGWVFVDRAPVRGPTSRRAVSLAKQATAGHDAASKARTTKARKAAKAAETPPSKPARATRAAKAGKTEETIGSPAPDSSSRAAKAAKAGKAAGTAEQPARAGKAEKAGKPGRAAETATPDKPTKAAKATKAGKPGGAAETATPDKPTRAAKATKAGRTSEAPAKAARATRAGKAAKAGESSPAAQASREQQAKRGGAGAEGAAEATQPGFNEALPFIEFVGAHPVGTQVDGTVEQFSSHGAYVRAGGIVGYVPLKHLADPAPRSARQVLRAGERRSFVVVSIDPARRGVDLALPGVPVEIPPAPAVVDEAQAAKAPAKKAPAKKAAAKRPAAKKPAAKKAAPKEAAGEAAQGAEKAEKAEKREARTSAAKRLAAHLARSKRSSSRR